jgi:hypothetical protein
MNVDGFQTEILAFNLSMFLGSGKWQNFFIPNSLPAREAEVDSCSCHVPCCCVFRRSAAFFLFSPLSDCHLHVFQSLLKILAARGPPFIVSH